MAVYKSLPKYTRLPKKTRQSYDSALRLVSQHRLKDGRLFGSLAIASIKPATADVLFDKLRVVAEPILGSDGNPITGIDRKPVMRMRERRRTAVLAVVCCRTAWNWARRDKRNHPCIESLCRGRSTIQGQADAAGHAPRVAAICSGGR